MSWTLFFQLIVLIVTVCLFGQLAVSGIIKALYEERAKMVARFGSVNEAKGIKL